MRWIIFIGTVLIILIVLATFRVRQSLSLPPMVQQMLRPGEKVLMKMSFDKTEQKMEVDHSSGPVHLSANPDGNNFQYTFTVTPQGKWHATTTHLSSKAASGEELGLLTFFDLFVPGGKGVYEKNVFGGTGIFANVHRVIADYTQSPNVQYFYLIR